MIRYERIKGAYFKKMLEHDNYFLSRSGRSLTGVQIENIVRSVGEKVHVREDIRCSLHMLFKLICGMDLIYIVVQRLRDMGTSQLLSGICRGLKQRIF